MQNYAFQHCFSLTELSQVAVNVSYSSIDKNESLKLFVLKHCFDGRNTKNHCHMSQCLIVVFPFLIKQRNVQRILSGAVNVSTYLMNSYIEGRDRNQRKRGQNELGKRRIPDVLGVVSNQEQ